MNPNHNRRMAWGPLPETSYAAARNDEAQKEDAGTITASMWTRRGGAYPQWAWDDASIQQMEEHDEVLAMGLRYVKGRFLQGVRRDPNVGLIVSPMPGDAKLYLFSDWMDHIEPPHPPQAGVDPADRGAYAELGYLHLPYGHDAVPAVVLMLHRLPFNNCMANTGLWHCIAYFRHGSRALSGASVTHRTNPVSVNPYTYCNDPGFMTVLRQELRKFVNCERRVACPSSLGRYWACAVHRPIWTQPPFRNMHPPDLARFGRLNAERSLASGTNIVDDMPKHIDQMYTQRSDDWKNTDGVVLRGAPIATVHGNCTTVQPAVTLSPYIGPSKKKKRMVEELIAQARRELCLASRPENAYPAGPTRAYAAPGAQWQPTTMAMVDVFMLANPQPVKGEKCAAMVVGVVVWQKVDAAAERNPLCNGVLVLYCDWGAGNVVSLCLWVVSAQAERDYTGTSCSELIGGNNVPAYDDLLRDILWEMCDGVRRLPGRVVLVADFPEPAVRLGPDGPGGYFLPEFRPDPDDDRPTPGVVRPCDSCSKRKPWFKCQKCQRLFCGVCALRGDRCRACQTVFTSDGRLRPLSDGP